MKTSTKLLLPLLAISLVAPYHSSAQTYSCPGGATPIVVPGFGTYCPANVSAPEIGASASVGGTTLLLCGFAMLRRRRKHTEA